MTMGPSPEPAVEYLRAADRALEEARVLLERELIGGAANRAYYAMFYAVHAALSKADVRRPKTHAGAINTFGAQYVQTGKIERDYAKDLQDARELRQKSDYELYGAGEDDVTEMVRKAEAFVARVRREVTG